MMLVMLIEQMMNPGNQLGDNCNLSACFCSVAQQGYFFSNMVKQKPSSTRRRRIDPKTLLKNDYERVNRFLFVTLNWPPFSDLLVRFSYLTAELVVLMAMFSYLKVRGLPCRCCVYCPTDLC